MKNNMNDGFTRMILYQFLALALYEPAENFFAALEGDNPERLTKAARQLLGPRGEQLVEKVLGSFRGPAEKREQLLLDLKVEYNRLFVGPMPPVCPPYESFYDEDRPKEMQRILMGPASEAMAEALRAEGLELTLDYAELPDHMSVQLEFMYYLLARAMAGEEDAGSYLEKANNFLKEHLSQWLPKLGVKVSQETRHPFYQGIGLLLEATVQADLEAVK